MRDDQIALQLWTVRALIAQDLPGTLTAVRAAGYRAVELAGLPDIAPVTLRGLLDGAELTAIASHEGIAGLREDATGVMDRLIALGCPRIYIPWMPEEDRLTHSDVRRFAAEIGQLATRFADRGIRLGYHNHDFEFAPLDGTTIWDILLAELPDDVAIELDVYWATIGGHDPIALIRGASDRIRALHMKDRSAGAAPHDLPAGEGILDFPAIVAAARAADVEWYIAEQDEPGMALDDIASAYRYLAQLAESPAQDIVTRP